MANRFSPSLTALLGLAAVAGYKNRDKISEFVKGLTGGGTAAAPAAAQQIPGGIAGALGGLVSHMQANGAGDVANSWVGTGANLPISGAQLSQVLGPDLMSKITTSTGMSADQLVAQLSAVLPQIVDHLTPQGQMPKA
ncbi:MAG: YidB family protein [Aestuariivirga sp.]